MPYGVVFNWTGVPSAYYRFMISGNGQFILFKNQPPNSDDYITLIPWTPSSLINKRGSNKLRVVTLDTFIFLYINDHLLITIPDDDPLRQGEAYFVVNGVQTIAFDNFRIEAQGSGKLVVPMAAEPRSYEPASYRGRPVSAPSSPE